MTEASAIALRIERAAATDWLNTLLDAPPGVVEATGLRVQRFGTAYATAMPRQKHYPINGTGATGLFEPASASLLDEYAAFFHDIGCGFGVSLSPVTRPDALTDWLRERGYTPGGRIPVLYRRAADPPPLPASVRIERIDAAQADLWRDTFGRMYVGYLADLMASFIGRPGRFHYLAFVGDTPAAASQMSITDGVACPHFSGVLSAYRGRGIQRGFIARRIRDALDAGCEWITTTCDEDTPEEPGYSMRNLLASGFTLLHHTQGYDAPAPA